MPDLQTMLDARPDLQSYLFRRGFLLTDADKALDLDAFPFYGN